MSKHRPGGWRADKTRVYIGDNPKDIGNEHDARLISAAPDLLEAAKIYIAYCLETEGEESILYETFTKAIAKAEGR